MEQAIKIAFKLNKEKMAPVTVSPEEALAIKKNKLRAEKREQDMRSRMRGIWAGRPQVFCQVEVSIIKMTNKSERNQRGVEKYCRD